MSWLLLLTNDNQIYFRSYVSIICLQVPTDIESSMGVMRSCNLRLLTTCAHLALVLLLLHSVGTTCLADQTEGNQLLSQRSSSQVPFQRNLALLLSMSVIVPLFLFGVCVICSRYLADRYIRRRLHLTYPIIGDTFQRGLAPKVINTFPMFEYSAAKGVNVGNGFLECAVCLNEFKNDETLRLLPTCNHVFHYQCIDVWLASHYTCPVCRADLSKNQKPTDTAFVAITIHETVELQSQNSAATSGVPGSECLDDPVLFSVDRPSHPYPSTGSRLDRSSPVQAWTEDSERFTSRLPEDANSQLVNGPSLDRTKSCVAFPGMRSSRKGYRDQSEDKVVQIGEKSGYNRTLTVGEVAADDDSAP